MLQFLKFDKKTMEDEEFPIISGSESIKFFLKRIGYVIVSLYSTIFVSAIDPFVKSPYEPWVFYAGGLITSIILLRLCNHAIKFIKFKNGKIVLKSKKIIVYDNNGSIEISPDNIKGIEVNIFGNIVFRSQGKQVSFPLMLLKNSDKENFLSSFEDYAKRKTRFLKKAYDFIDALLVAFVLAMHIREYIVQAYFIPTGSMEDTLIVGDHLLVEKITYGQIIPKMMGMEKEIHLKFLGIRDIKRNDIVIFRPPNEDKKDYIKRCIAVSGDELHITNNSVFVNGKKINEPYVKGFTNYDGFRDKKIEGIVPQGHVVVMGDNRENSFDSRGFGYLPLERIKGRAFILYWNTKQIKNLDFSRYGLIR